MITLTRLRTLTLDAPTEPGRPSYVSAASGLVRQGDFLYVVADDENHMAVFRGDGSAPGHAVRLFEGALPDEHKARKKQKPDFEALTRLPPFGVFPNGALLACGSGSKINRRRGALVGFNPDGGLAEDPHIVDMSFLMTPLEAEFGKLNLEGVVVAGEDLRAFQRGNKGQKRNAMIRFQLAAVLEALATRSAASLTPISHHDIDLGEIDGVPLTFTDAACLPNGDMAFSAVAEDTENAYDDGACGGAAVGLLGGDGTLRWIEPTKDAQKIEGIDARLEDGVLRLLLVTDADDISIPAGLFTATISHRSA